MSFTQALTFFCTRDLVASERFYGGTLGLTAVIRTGSAILWRITDTAFFGVTSGPGRTPAPGAAIVELCVDSAEAVQGWYDRITADRWETDGPPRHVEAGATCFFATDPNGYLVEVLHFDDAAALRGTA